MNEKSNSNGGGLTELPLFPLEMVLFPGIPVRFISLRSATRRWSTFVCARSVPFGIVLRDRER